MNSPSVSPQQALYLARLFNINLRVIPLSVWQDALQVELEHGRRYGKLTDVTHGVPSGESPDDR